MSKRLTVNKHSSPIINNMYARFAKSVGKREALTACETNTLMAFFEFENNPQPTTIHRFKTHPCMTNGQIAERLSISEGTVSTNIMRVRGKWDQGSKHAILCQILSSNQEHLIPIENPIVISPSEMSVSRQLSMGLTNLQIGNQLNISWQTVRCCLNNIFKKMGEEIPDDRALVIDAYYRDGLTTKAELIAKEMGPWSESPIELTVQQMILVRMWTDEAIGKLPTDLIKPMDIKTIAQEIYRIQGAKDKKKLILSSLRGGFTTQALMTK